MEDTILKLFPPEFKGQAIVCFVDLLGFAQDILNNWNAIKDNPSKE